MFRNPKRPRYRPYNKYKAAVKGRKKALSVE
jgi:hypothetical protein